MLLWRWRVKWDLCGRQCFHVKHSLKNLILLIDYNKLQSYGRTNEILDLGLINCKIEKF